MRKLFFLLAAMTGFANLVLSQTVPTDFTVTPISSGWTTPVGAAFTSNGQKLFVWDKGGKVFVCNRDAGGNYVKQATAVLDIAEETGNWRDHGMLGFALDPNFAVNGRIYIMYVVDRQSLKNYVFTPSTPTTYYYEATIGRITRYTTTTNASNITTADPASRVVLLGETISTGIPILHESHGVGSLAFAADGTLLASVGDGASYSNTDGGSRSETYFDTAQVDGIIRANENVGAFRAQMLNSHSGKLLRIDPETGDGVASNPFYDPLNPRSPKSRVWALGFRNPFRIAVKPGSGSNNPAAGDIGEVYVGDVGWNGWEELNIVRSPGQNCGWPLYEGHTSLASYFNLNKQNADEPNPLGCAPFFTFNQLLKQATADEITTVYNPCNTSVPIGTGNRHYHRRPAIDWKHGTASSRVGKFSGNNAVVYEIGTPQSEVAGTPFAGNCAIGGTWYTGMALPPQYRNTFLVADLGTKWLKSVSVDFTDVVTRVDNLAGNFTNIASITENPLDGSLVTVEIGATGVKRITYGGNNPPVTAFTANKKYGSSPLTVAFDGTQSAASNPGGSIVEYAWDFGDPASGTSNTSNLVSPSHIFVAPPGVPTVFTAKLTVKDNLGLSSFKTMTISVNNTPPIVNITSPVKNSLYKVGSDTMYSCSATVIDNEHSGSGLSYAWQTFFRHNNHEHSEEIDEAIATQTKITRVGCSDDIYYWMVKLTVTDAAGLSTSDSTKIFPDCGVTLAGELLLQGRPAAPHALWQTPVEVDLYLPSVPSTPLMRFNVNTDQYGRFILPVPVGDYHFAVKALRTLSRVKQLQTIGNGINTIQFGTMRAGDANNDNMVTLADFSLLLTSFNKQVGDPGFLPEADFNGDGRVTLLDFSLLLFNYNQAGEHL